MRISGIVITLLFALSSCKKDRQCECKNSNGTYIAGDIKATKGRAKKHCESLSTGATTCYLK